MRPIFLLAFLLGSVLSGPAGLAQIRRSVKVLEAPEAGPYSIGDPDFQLENGYAGEPRWVVFVSHDGAPTFSRAAGISRVQTLPFMQPCYVIGQRGDYLKLAKYNPRLVSRRWMPHRIANWKEVEYLGWIHRSQVMPYRLALKDRDNKFFLKYITALSGKEVFETPQAFFVSDSLKIFGRPDVAAPLRGALPINTLVYAYRLSSDRKFCLVGKGPQCQPDSAAKILLGWMPVQTVQPWGEKAFVEVPAELRAAGEDATGTGNVDLTLRPASDAQVALPLADEVLNRYTRRAQSLMPIYAIENGTGGAPSVVRTAALTNVLDARDNRVFNVLGAPVSYNRYQDLKGAMRRLNVVLLVDGTTDRADFSAPVMTVLQQLQMRLDSTTRFDAVRYAGVLYNGAGAPDCLPDNALPLTSSYSALSGFFEKGLARVRGCNAYGGNVYSGLPQASGLLAGHEDESNVVIVVGSSAATGQNAYNWNALINGLTTTNARLIVYQTHSDASTAYNDYVIDAKKLIVQSAGNIGELRKEFLVEASTAASDADFRLSTGEQNAFLLDYPAASRWQGAVVFPAKLGAMPLLSLNTTLDTVMMQMHDDNSATMGALDRVFESYAGNLGTRVDERFEPAFGQYTEALPEHTRRYFRKAFDVFRFPARLPMTDSAMLGRGLLLSREEFEQYLGILDAASFVLQAPATDRARTGRLLRRQTKSYVRATGARRPMPYRRMTVADALAVSTGLPVEAPALQRVRLKRLGKVDDAEYTAVQSAVRNYNADLKKRQAAGALQGIPVAAGAAPTLWIREPL